MRLQKLKLLWVIGCLFLIGNATASAFGGVGIKVGMDLARKTTDFGTTQFDKARFMVGGYIDLGSIVFPKLRLVPGVDVIVQDNLRIYSINTEGRYRISVTPKTVFYVGFGVGVHLSRFDLSSVGNAAGLGSRENDTKVTINIPIGVRRKVGPGIGWFGELKLIVAENEVDSSFRISTGISLGN